MTTHWLRTLGLPLRSPRATWAAAAAVFAYYALSMSRDMSVFDSPELALVAMQGGLGHPVGQPLHTVLGYVLAHVPGLPSLVGVNLLSALPGALLVVPAMSIADGWAGASNPRRNWVPAAVLAVWALAEPAWETATRVEVYALASLLALWSVAKVLATLRAEVVGVRGALFAAGVALGLSASTNPYVAIVAALAVMPAVLRALATRRLGPLPAVMAVLGGVVGLVPYVYVPLVAGREDVFVWSSPATSSTLSAYLRGQDYASARTLSFGGWVEHLGAWWGWAAATGVLGQVLVGLLASSRFVWARRSGALAFVVALVLAIALVASNTVWEPDIPDYVSYLVPALWLGGAAAAALASELVRADQTRALAALGVLVVLSVFFVAPAPGLRTRAHDHVSRTLAAAALDDLPKGAILVADGGHWIAPLLYLQQAEHRRKDVILVPTGFASSSWYWEFLFRQHPELKAPRLRGPGGRAGRVLRLATQNPGREVHVTTFEEAQTLGRAPCLLG
ncbi:MAG: DUF2723 domain-containing protein, partial [Myxococcales bacterium]|nr:DUF2723 domain-containing protein [Myxococcales bacterium]